MTINNIGEFFHFVKNNGLVGLSPEVQSLVSCMEEYGRLCSCNSTLVKTSKINKCKSLYTIFVSKSINYKSILLSKVSDNQITFNNDGQLITTIHH